MAAFRLLTAANCCARPVVGFITNGEGCNIDWRKELPEYDVADAGDKNFLLSQQLWNLDERLPNRRPEICAGSWTARNPARANDAAHAGSPAGRSANGSMRRESGR